MTDLYLADDELLEPLDIDPATLETTVDLMLTLQQEGDADDHATDEPAGDKLDATPVVGLVSVPAASGSLDEMRARVMAYAAGKVGTLENPRYSNRIFVWDQIAPSFSGSPWCQGFVVLAWALQGVDLRKVVDLPYYCPSLEAYARKIGAWRPYGGGYTPKPGDPVLMGRGSSAAHVGLAYPGPGQWSGYRTIEGNTSRGTSGSQTNGDGVWLRYRGSFIRGWVDMDVVHADMTRRGLIKRAAVAPRPVVAAVAPKPVPKPTGDYWRGKGRPLSIKATLGPSEGNRRIIRAAMAKQGYDMDDPASLRAYQAAIRVPVTGMLDAATIRKTGRWAGWRIF